MSKIEVCISGVGGCFPHAENIKEFGDILLENKHISDDALWTKGELGVCSKVARIEHNNVFDGSFFGVHRKQSTLLDPMQKKALEGAYEAIVDSGVNPADLRGEKVGVYFSSTISENDCYMFDPSLNGFGIIGQSRSMFANRVSYFLNLTGPSCSFESTWTSGIQVIKLAMSAISNGQCNSALVGSCNMTKNASLSWMLKEMGLLSEDDTTKAFDENATGYSRSDGVCVLYLQRSDLAKRNYATLLSADVMFNGDRNGNILKMDPEGISLFLNNFYENAGINLNDVQYLETYGCGVKKIDESELAAVENVLCKNRSKPLKIGSVKTNFGHAEGCSAMFGIMKLIVMMENGIIPATLHYKTPNKNIPALVNGSLEVVTQNTEWDGTLAALNAFGLPSSYGHLLLKLNPKTKQNSKLDLPLLTCFSSRTEEGMNAAIDKIKNRPSDPEFCNLVHNVYKTQIPLHLYRGFVLKGTENIEAFSPFAGNKRPIWFVYSGMGSQWTKMGKDLMALPIFRRSIEKIQKMLEPKEIDLIKIITEDDPTIFNNILYSFVGIAAIQVALTDILKAIGIIPNGIIGHSVGELGCAYADECLTSEQMIMCAIYRGKASNETKLISGLMAAVGMGYNQMKDLVPPSIEVACHNGPDSCTISGPMQDVKDFVAVLKAKGIFAKLVNVSNIAYHSRYIQPAAPKLLTLLEEEITNPVARSTKWISTSVKETEWQTPSATTASAEYFTNNLLSSVLFEEGLHHIPDDAILIEIAPHGLLQAILKRSLSSSCSNFSLTKRNSNGLDFLFNSLGQLYSAGVEMDLTPLYPPVSYPVSRGTGCLAEFIDWAHVDQSIGFESMKYIENEKHYAVTLNKNDFRYISDHRIDGKIYIPVSVYLKLVTDIFFQTRRNESIIFENIFINKHLHISESGELPLAVIWMEDTGRFEVSDYEEVIMTGVLRALEPKEKKQLSNVPKSNALIQYSDISGKDFYQVLNHRGYDYQSVFRAVKLIRKAEEGINASINWENDWKIFVDAMLQLHIFRSCDNNQDIHAPSFIRSLAIDLYSLPKTNEELEVSYHANTEIMSTSGFKMTGVSCDKLPIEGRKITIDENKYIRFFNEEAKDIKQAINMCLQIIVENTQQATDFQVLEFKNSKENFVISKQDFSTFTNVKVTIYSSNKSKTIIRNSPSLIVANEEYYKDGLSIFKNVGEFLLLVLPSAVNLQTPKDHIVITKLKVQDSVIYLIKKAVNIPPKVLNVKNESYSYPDVKEIAETCQINTKLNSDQMIFLTFTTLPTEGIKSFIKHVKSNPSMNKIRFIFLLDKNAPECLPIELHYQIIFRQDLLCSVLKNGNWGTYLDVSVDVVHNKSILVNNIVSTSIQTNANSICKIECLGLNVTEVTNDESRKEVQHVDYVGLNASGQRVMGLARTQSNGLKMLPDPNFIWTVPNKWTSSDAATVPYAYIMAYYTLFEVGQLKMGETVLVNAGCTTFAQACVIVASTFGCPVYVTVETDLQRACLKDIVPKLDDDNILNSEDPIFDIRLLKESKVGAHLVINSIQGESLQAAKRCLGSYGRFVQIGLAPTDKYSTTGMNCFLRCCSMSGVDPENLFQKSISVKQRIQELVQNGIDTGVVRPLEKIIYDQNIDQDIFRYLRSSKCCTAAVFNIEKREFAKPKSKLLDFNNDGVYMIYGNISEELVDLAEWLISQGLKKLIIATTSQFNNYYVNQRLALLDYYHSIESFLIMKSAETVDKAKDLISEAETYGNLVSIFIVPNKNNSGNDFDFNIARNLDLALTLVNPKTNLVCLLGNNTDKAFARLNEMSVHNIKWSNSCSFGEVLKILENILSKEGNVNVTVKNNLKVIEKKKTSKTDIFATLPNTLQNLKENGCVNDQKLIQVLTKCPMALKWMTPFFIVPGILSPSNTTLKKFVQQIMYPAYCVNIEDDIIGSKTGEYLGKMIIEKHEKGPYNIIGISWGGALSIDIAKYLEKMGKKVQLFLIDSAPDTLKPLAEDCKNIKQRLLKRLLNISEDKEKYENVNEILDNFKSNECLVNAETIHKALNIIDSYIEAIQKYEPNGELLNGQTTLFRPANSSKTDSCGLTKYCKQVRIQVINEDHCSMLTDECLHEYLNDNLII